jgi:hypothetical protein
MKSISWGSPLLQRLDKLKQREDLVSLVLALVIGALPLSYSRNDWGCDSIRQAVRPRGVWCSRSRDRSRSVTFFFAIFLTRAAAGCRTPEQRSMLAKAALLFARFWESSFVRALRLRAEFLWDAKGQRCKLVQALRPFWGVL